MFQIEMEMEIVISLLVVIENMLLWSQQRLPMVYCIVLCPASVKMNPGKPVVRQVVSFRSLRKPKAWGSNLAPRPEESLTGYSRGNKSLRLGSL